MENNLSAKTPLRMKIAYGSIEFQNTLGLVLFTSFGMYFLTDIAGLSPGVAGTITALGSLINAIAGPFFGMASDGCKSKYGRRRPFIIGMIIPANIIVCLLFTVVDFGAAGNTVYYCVLILLFYIIGCGLDVPYTSLGAEITKDYDERSSLNFWRSLFCQVASVISGALPISIAAAIGTAVNDMGKGWTIMAMIFAGVSLIVGVTGWRLTRGTEKYREDNEALKLKDFADAFRNKTFVYTLLMYSAGIGAYAIGLTLNVYFLMDCIALTEGQISIVLVIFNVAAIVWLPLIPFISKKYSKPTAWVVFMGLWGLTLIGQFFFGYPGNLTIVCILTAIGGCGSMVAYTVGWAMLPDCIEIDEFKTGKRREGMYYGVLTIAQKGSQALLIFIAGLMLEFVGYDETIAVQSDATLFGIRVAYTAGAIVCILLSFLFIKLYPLTREKHGKLLKAIEQKRAGEEPDMEGIEDLL